MKRMTIYWNPDSYSAKRVRMCAHELELAPEYVALEYGEKMKTPEHKARNPMGKIPVIADDDGWSLWESPAILYYMAEQHGGGRLLPPGVRGRADALRWMFWNATHWEGSGWGVVYKGPDAEASAGYVARYSAVLDAHLAGRTWLAGDDFSIADIALACTAEMFVSAKLDLGANVAAWYERVTSRPSWAFASQAG